MLIGFGCSVPAILGTRILENRRDRLVTILVIPLMSCSARLPIYSLIIPAFFPTAWQGPMLWTIYILGMLLAVGFTKLLRSTVFRGESTPFIMELPPYRVPTAQGLWIHAWERGTGYLRKAGTIILSISIILWWATAYPRAGIIQDMPNLHQTISMENRAAVEQIETSYAGQFSKAIEPALKPMGFDWRIGTALLGAVAAKEVFVAQLGIVFSMGQNPQGTNTLGKRLRENYTPLVGFCVMLFMLIGMPCLATVAAARSETGSWGWALFQWGGLTAVAWILTTIVYQAGTALRLGV
jgi:ferrous iron transport protein B